MTKATLFIMLASASFAVAAQQQPRTQENTQNAAKPGDDKELVDRARVDGSAGGTAPVAAEKRKAVGAGAGPNLHDTKPSPQKLPRDEPVAPRK